MTPMTTNQNPERIDEVVPYEVADLSHLAGQGRITVLVRAESVPGTENAELLSQATGEIARLELNCGLELDLEKTALYAVASPNPDSDLAGIAPYLQAAFDGDRWHRRADAAAGTAGDAAWAQQVARATAPDADGRAVLLTAWDLYPKS